MAKVETVEQLENFDDPDKVEKTEAIARALKEEEKKGSKETKEDHKKPRIFWFSILLYFTVNLAIEFPAAMIFSFGNYGYSPSYGGTANNWVAALRMIATFIVGIVACVIRSKRGKFEPSEKRKAPEHFASSYAALFLFLLIVGILFNLYLYAPMRQFVQEIWLQVLPNQTGSFFYPFDSFGYLFFYEMLIAPLAQFHFVAFLGGYFLCKSFVRVQLGIEADKKAAEDAANGVDIKVIRRVIHVEQGAETGKKGKKKAGKKADKKGKKKATA